MQMGDTEDVGMSRFRGRVVWLLSLPVVLCVCVCVDDCRLENLDRC